MKVLVDTNVLLDFLLEREPFKKDTEELFAAIDSGQNWAIEILYPDQRYKQVLGKLLHCAE